MCCRICLAYVQTKFAGKMLDIYKKCLNCLQDKTLIKIQFKRYPNVCTEGEIYSKYLATELGHQTVPYFYGMTARKNGYVPVPSGRSTHLQMQRPKGHRGGMKKSKKGPAKAMAARNRRGGKPGGTGKAKGGPVAGKKTKK
ncbi:hypothetical protein B0H11DRAFT_1905058 [Mycena galericulata]|nr:hypothetical protein B0H11DRAFT_1905058 [Mycena galericulata]